MEFDKGFCSILKGDLYSLRQVIRRHRNTINQTNSCGLSYLMAACRLGDTDLIEFLIKSGADLEKSDSNGDTALHYAVLGNQCDVVALIVSKGANVNSRNSQGKSPLRLAVQRNSTDLVKAVLNATTIKINEGDDRGWTPLHSACREGHAGVVEQLLSHKPDVGVRDQYDRTPLHFACLGGHAGVVRRLLPHKPDVNVMDQDGWTPLHSACYGGHTEVVRHLLPHKPDLDIQEDWSGRTPLHLAVIKGRYNVVKLMLTQYLLKLDIGDCDGRTPLLDAVEEGHLGIIHKLTSKGADMNAVDNEGNNCLHFAVKIDRFRSECESLDILDEFCSRLNWKKKDRLSGSVVACYLAHHGANFYYKNKNNMTPLDLIKNQRLKEKIKTFFPPPLPCLLCEVNDPTVQLHPCGHIVTCKECSKIALKRCPKCRQNITGKSGFDGSQVQDETTCTICMERRWNMVFECGHTTCKECGEKLHRCHLCRKQIKKKIIIH